MADYKFNFKILKCNFLNLWTIFNECKSINEFNSRLKEILVKIKKKNTFTSN